MKKIVYAIMLALVFLLPCLSSAEIRSVPKIAALLNTSANPFFQMMWEGIKKEADAEGVGVELFWPQKETDFEYQYSFLKNRAEYYDVLLIAPSNPEGVIPYLPEVKKKGTKIVLLDVGPDYLPAGARQDDYFDVFIGTDNEDGGRLAAKFAKQYLINKKSPQVIVVGGFPSHMNAPGRTLMFENEIKSYFPDVRIQRYSTEYDPGKSRQVVVKNINNFRVGELIFCANDNIALSVIDEMLNRGLKLPPIIGYDSTKEAQRAMLEGKMSASVVQFPARIGSAALKSAVDLLNGKAVQRKVLIKPAITVRKVQIETIAP